MILSWSLVSVSVSLVLMLIIVIFQLPCQCAKSWHIFRYLHMGIQTPIYEIFDGVKLHLMCLTESWMRLWPLYLLLSNWGNLGITPSLNAFSQGKLQLPIWATQTSRFQALMGRRPFSHIADQVSFLTAGWVH